MTVIRSAKLIMSAANGTLKRNTNLTKEALEKATSRVQARQALTLRGDSANFNNAHGISKVYDLEDVVTSGVLNSKGNENLAQIIRENFDTDIPCAKILGTNKTVFLETVTINRNPIKDRMLYYAQRYSFQDAANVFHRANKFYDANYIDDSMKLLEEYPLEHVLKLMPEGVMNTQGHKTYGKGLLNFIANNPGKRSVVVVKNADGIEAFDNVAAGYYKIFEGLCKTDEELERVLKACRYENKDGFFMLNEDLCDFAFAILRKKKEFNNFDKLIFEKFSRA